MEHKFAAFTAFAALTANNELRDLLQKHSLTPTVQVLTDAARYGQQKAFERFFPGLVRLPFERDPLPEILLGLRYLYEADPENLGTAPEPRDPSATYSGRYRVSSASVNRPAAGPSDTQSRGIVPTPLNKEPKDAKESSSRYPYLPASNATPNGEESSKGAVGASSTDARGNLRKIGPAPVFPWEKRRGS